MTPMHDRLTSDELRRHLRDAQRAQDAALPRWRDALARAFSGDARLSATDKADLVLGGLARRRFLQVGGLSVATAAVLAACGGGTEGNVPTAGLPSPTTGFPERSVDDIVLLRTASSLERSAVFTYDAALPLLPAPVAEVARLFRDHHEAHARQAESVTEQIGGKAFTEPNPVIQADVILPTLEVITAQTNPEAQLQQIVTFAHSIERIAAATYQSTVPVFTRPELRQAAMSVGAVEARHAAVLAALIEGSQPVAGLDALDAAPTTVGTTTTTVAATPAPGQSTTTTSPVLALPEEGVFQVPAPFESLAGALGPNSYVYDERTLVPTEPG